MTTEELTAALAGRDGQQTVLCVGPGYTMMEVLRMANPLRLFVSGGAGLRMKEWKLVPLEDWLRKRG